MKKISKQLLLCGLIALTGCAQKPQTAPVTGYNLVTLQPEDRTISTSYSASIQGRQDIAIYPQVSGYITKLAVTEGQKVKKGQTLFIIDQVPYQAALNTATANVKAAEASLATAKLTYENKEKLFEKNVISDVDLTTARNNYLTAQAQLAQMQAQEVNARNNLSYTVVTSPSDGVIGVLPYREGALVSASLPQPLTTVSDNSEMYVYFSMTENQLLSLLKEYGSKEAAIAEMPAVELQLSDGSLYETPGHIEAISGVIDQSTGSVSVKAVFENKNGLLHSGASGNIVIPETIEQCVVIPQAATFEVQEKIFAYKVTDGIANPVEVSVTKVNGGKDYIVNSGLTFGDTIVAEGAGLLRAGTRVQAEQPAAAPAPAADAPAEETPAETPAEEA